MRPNGTIASVLLAAVLAGCGPSNSDDILPPVPPRPVPHSYYDRVVLLLYDNVVVYPPQSIRDHEQGQCQVRVRFQRSGEILQTELVQATPYSDLNKECLAVFARVKTVPAASAEFQREASQIEFLIPFWFKVV